MSRSDKDNDTPQPDEGRFFSKMPDLTGHLIFWPIAIIGVAADLWSKYWVFKWLGDKPPDYEHTVVEGFLTFVVRMNAGAAFSMASGQRGWLIAISVIAFFVVVGLFLFGGAHRRIMQVSLGLFTGGIIGNLYDRIDTGLVRDFIDVVYWPGKHWPAFNVADSMLCTAVGLIIICNLTSASSRKSAHRQK